MSEEVQYVIERLRQEFSNWEDEVKVLYTEDGVMHTIKVGNQIYKAIKTNESWKLMEMK